MILFVDLKAQHASIKNEINEAVARVFDNCEFVLGSEVEAFEDEFAAYCNADYAIGVNSGTSALHLALLAAGIGLGDEVITVPFTFVATVSAICYTGAHPVFVDIEPRSLTIDVNSIENAITERTKAILPVHIYGQPADMDPILDIARRYNLRVIEDASQAHGAVYKRKLVGNIGDLGCFSFYPSKNLGACGEGGMVVTNNREFVRTIRMLRDWGAAKKNFHDLKGFNYRLGGIQGAVLRVKLRHLDKWIEARRNHVAQYDDMMANMGIQRQKVLPNSRHVYHIYSVRITNRDALQQALKVRGVQTGIHYPIPVHLQKGYADLGYHKGDFPYSEQAADEVLSLPMYAELTKEKIQFVATSLIESFKEF
jgi:dTDP-4-amino-4,6-dideoxygalactose transaminase